MLEQNESRNFIRIDTACDVSYKFPDSNDRFMGQSINISGSGILFLSARFIDVGIALEVKVIPKKRLIPSMVVYVEVSCIKEIKSNEFEVTAEIKGIKES
jgi:hypothetical protein